LGLLGFADAPQQWVKEVFGRCTKYTTLDAEQFESFVRGYKKRTAQAFAEAFKSRKSDKEGKVDIADLVELLRVLGKNTRKYVAVGVIKEVDRQSLGCLDVNEFHKVMDIIRFREGFSKREYDALLDVFHKFEDTSGEVDVAELYLLLEYVDRFCDLDSLAEIVREVDIDGGGTFSPREYLLAMRRLREVSDERIRQAMVAFCLDDQVSERDAADGSPGGSGNGGIDHLVVPVGDFRSLLHLLGLFPDQDAVVEAAAEAGIGLEEGTLDFGDICHLLEVLSAHEELSRADIGSARETFLHFATPEDGLLPAHEIDIALRWMGFQISFEMRELLFSQVDIKGRGKLDAEEFLKLVRMSRALDIQQMVDVFRKFDKIGKGVLAKEAAQQAFKSIQFFDGRGDLPKPSTMDLQGSLVDLGSFVQSGTKLKQNSRRFFRDNEGFSHREIQELKSRFGQLDTHGTEVIDHGQTMELILSICPELTAAPLPGEEIPNLQELIQEADDDGSNTLDLQDFLGVMRKVFVICDARRVIKARKAIEESGFSRHEVREFRQLFLKHDKDVKGVLTLTQIQEMLAIIQPTGSKNTDVHLELCVAFKGFGEKQQGSQGNTASKQGKLDFPEFLLMMQHLLDTNFGMIKDRTEAS